VTESEVKVSTYSTSLAGVHVSIAVEQLKRSLPYARKLPGTTLLEDALIWRASISGVLHSFCAVESMVNYVAHQMFHNTDSARYVGATLAPLLRQLLKFWDRMGVVDRVGVLLSESGAAPLPAPLENNLRELNTLRNWIAHGLTFTTTHLEEIVRPDEQTTSFTTHDIEDSVDWKKKFPTTKFKAPTRINHVDAVAALTIALETLKVILRGTSALPLLVSTFDGEPEIVSLELDEGTPEFLARFGVVLPP